jgi:N6-adenosine-specific RNA methylase IME4
MEVKIDAIKVSGRYRSEYGDIEGLAESIKAVGLLHPPIVDSEYRLIDGERRIRAVRLMGLDAIEVRVINVASLLQAEHDANAFAKQWTVSEKVAIGRAIEEELSKRVGRPAKEMVENFPPFSQGKSRDLAAEKSGLGSGKTYEAAKTVVDSGVPELVTAMDSGKVSISAAADVATLPVQQQKEVVARGEKEILEAAKAIRTKKAEARRIELQAQREEAMKIPLPTGKYRCIVIDPPWEMAKFERDVRPNQTEHLDYPTMSLEELEEIELGDMAADDGCHLFCWTTQKYLRDSIHLVEQWGFTYSLLMVWHKPGGPQPFNFPQYNCEFIIYARKNAPDFIDTKQFFVCFEAPRREHSRKPDEFYDVIKRVTAGPRIEVFSREKREGFDQFGDETEKFVA